jgi:hypothetical protein
MPKPVFLIFYCNFISTPPNLRIGTVRIKEHGFARREISPARHILYHKYDNRGKGLSIKRAEEV